MERERSLCGEGMPPTNVLCFHPSHFSTSTLTRTFTHAHTYTHSHTYTHTHIHTHSHTHSHTFTHIHSLTFSFTQITRTAVETWMAASRFELDRCVLQVQYQMKKLLDETNVLLILKKVISFLLNFFSFLLSPLPLSPSLSLSLPLSSSLFLSLSLFPLSRTLLRSYF